MKVINYQIILLLLTIGFSSCEKNEVKNTEEAAGYIQLIEFRSSCIECPGVDECCCGVWVQQTIGGTASIHLCGTSDGSGLCSDNDPPGDCPAISGGGQGPFDLVGPDTGKRRFCMNEGDTFWIANTHPTETMHIYLSCQDDITNGQVLTISIPAGQRWYYEVNNACELTLCEE